MKFLRSREAAVPGVVLAIVVLVGGAQLLGHREGPSTHASAAPPARAAMTGAADNDPESAPRPPALRAGVASASFGQRMVDDQGRTLYVFSADRPGRATCQTACATEWPPVRSPGGKPQPGTGAVGPRVGSIQRSDGSDQVTFDGYPVYYYSGDQAAGDTRGQGRSAYGGRWSAVPPGLASGAGAAHAGGSAR